MAFKCFNCGKGSQHGWTGKHGRGVAGGRWKKRAQKTPKLFKPNLHMYRMVVGGVAQKVKLCTKCLRKIKTPYKAKTAAVSV